MDHLRLEVNGRVLTGTRLNGNWKFDCSKRKDLEKRFDGDDYATGIVWEFIRWVLMGEPRVGSTYYDDHADSEQLHS